VTAAAPAERPGTGAAGTGAGNRSLNEAPAAVVDRLRREQFPVTAERTWFNTATYGPLPSCNVAAQRDLLDGMMRGAGGPGIGHWWEGAASVRDRVGALIGCDAGDVALLRSTGEGIGLVSLGLDWRPGDEVVLYDQDERPLRRFSYSFPHVDDGRPFVSSATTVACDRFPAFVRVQVAPGLDDLAARR